MSYRIRTENHPEPAGLDATAFVLEEDAGAARAVVWPAFGFNCLRWEVGGLDLLYAEPQLSGRSKPTRSGIPVLFPFPNRIRAGRFRWADRDYQLPLNDPSGQNAIHGFACRRPWRVVGQGADAASAWVTGEFWGAHDAPEARALWPADYRLRLTCRLVEDRLRLEAVVDNPDRVDLPFGLGYHPYVRVPLVPGARAEDCRVQADVAAAWVLDNALPTGRGRPPEPAEDLRQPRPYTELHLDNLYQATVRDPEPGPDRLCVRGSVVQAPSGTTVWLAASVLFRELVAFTPPSRQAVALEPYTCITDAINMQQQGVDAGLLVLPPGKQWSGVVELRCTTGEGG
jgi:aldose 1-epimerase